MTNELFSIITLKCDCIISVNIVNGGLTDWPTIHSTVADSLCECLSATHTLTDLGGRSEPCPPIEKNNGKFVCTIYFF